MTSRNLIDRLEALQSSKFNQFALDGFNASKKFLKKVSLIMLGYVIMSWLFLSIYDSFGFEKTLIILLIGVLWYGIRKN